MAGCELRFLVGKNDMMSEKILLKIFDINLERHLNNATINMRC